jgi:hypothetical protein
MIKVNGEPIERNAVTKPVTKSRAAVTKSKVGRPAKHASDAQRQAAYRQRQRAKDDIECVTKKAPHG